MNDLLFCKKVFQWTRQALDNYKYKQLVIGSLNHKQYLIFMRLCQGKYVLLLNITTPKEYQIQKVMI